MRSLSRLAPLVALAVASACASGRPVRLNRCREHGGQACHEAAKAELTEGGDADPVAAATFLMTSCESGWSEACNDLAGLYHAGTGVPHDEAEACRLGRAASCVVPPAAAPPSGPRAPPLRAAGGTDDRQFYEGIGRSYPEPWRAALGMTPAALEQRPPAPRSERALMDVVSGPRLRAAEACLPVLVDATGRARLATSGAVSFTVGQDGRPAELAVRAWPDGHRWAAEWERCVADAIAPWRLPDYPSGGRFFFEVLATGPGRVDDALREEASTPVFATRGYTKPKPAWPHCVQDSMTLRRPPAGDLGFTVLFAVRADGRPDLFKVITRGVPEDVVEDLRSAVLRCRWIPGTDPAGRPTDLWVIMPMRFSSH